MAIQAISSIVAGFFLVFGSACATDYISLASSSVEDNQYEAAIEFLTEGASKGDPRCDYYLAVLMLSGEIEGERDSQAASVWLRTAVDAGIPDAQLDLGRLYESGDGVDRDLAKAAALYRKAADAGLPAGQAQLGALYAVGKGVEQDTAMATDLYRKAAKSGDPLGQAALGVASFHGIGVPKNLIDGYMWTKLAARQGNPEANSILRVIVAEMTPSELKKARYMVSKYSAKSFKTVQYRTKAGIDVAADAPKRRRSSGGSGLTQ